MAEPTKPKKSTVENIKQGVEQIYFDEHDAEINAKTNLDVVFVPGLGAKPRESWQSTKTGWNWAFDKHGLIRDYPAARIFLYSQESAFHGSYKVEQFLDNLAIGLLDSLQAKRGDQTKRPLVFIGHSMGGLIIAKAITLMETRRDLYKEMLEATAGCIFFGTPFLGAEAAEAAAMFAVVGEKFGLAIPSKLLDIMKPGDEMLRDLRGQFLHLVSKTSPKIEVHCFWEERDTKVADMGAEFIKKYVGDRVAMTVSSLFTTAKESFKIVTHKSATFDNALYNSGLACTHRDLVKFDDFKSGIYEVMRGPLKRIIHGAPVIARNRLNSARNIDADMMKNITKALGGGMSFQAKRKALEHMSSSWLPTEPEFTEWLALGHGPHETEPSDGRRGDSLWICGAEGRGKTGAFIAALGTIEATIEEENRAATGKASPLLVYYFCEPTDESTAEELLKSLLWQLTQERPALASYAKQFTERLGRRAMSLPIEILWQSLQDMFSDLTASSCIYILVNNLHHLSAESDSTRKLLELIKDDLEITKAGTVNRTSVRWLFTSRKARRNIDANLNGKTNRVIDLDNVKYMNQVQLELRKHAQQKVTVLSMEKEYKKDLAYFVSSLIGKRAKNSGWIDITVDQLEKLDKDESALRVRQKLKTLPQDLDDLLDGAWEQIFKSNPDQFDVITEMLRALALTYEDPSLEELAILAGFQVDEECLDRLRDTVELCSSFLTIRSEETRGDVVYFKNKIAKPHLLRHAAKLLGLLEEEIQWQQGELALRSLAHLIERYTLPGDEEKLDAEKLAEKIEEQAQANQKEAGETSAENDENGTESQEEDEEENQVDNNEDEVDEEESQGDNDEHGDDEEESQGDNDEHGDDDDEEEEEDDDESTSDESEYEELEAEALPYMVKHWLHHASKATLDMAETLSKETEFWGKSSLVRRRWLAQYKNVSDTFRFSKRIPIEKWTALHVAASFGYRQLVSALIDNGHGDELNEYDDWSYAPIHLASFYGRPNITEELIYRGAAADDVAKPGEETPLAMAAYSGDLKVMKLLLAASADVNAESTSDGSEGLVLNCAICSGNLEAVKLLVDKGAIIHSDKWSPLEWASTLPDRKIFDYLLEAGQAHLQPHDYGMGLKGAAEYGNTEVFAQLLERDHDQQYVQTALNSATGEDEWDIVRLILNKHKGLDCDDLFKGVATDTEDLEELLEVVWRYAAGSISQEALDQALYEATDNEKESIVGKLLGLGADANATGPDYGNALTAAAYDGKREIVAMLLDAGAHVNSTTGWALQTAAGEGHLPVVELLLEAGAEVNACTEDERFPQGTALQAAVESAKSEIVTLLLSKDADPNLGSGTYVCPLIAAACKSEGEMLKQLIASGANVNVDGGTSFASTPLINAAMYLPVASVKVLLDSGAHVNHTDVDGDSALTVAAAEGDIKIVECLLGHGADIRAVSKFRGNALQAAFGEGKQDCVKVLIDHVSRMLLEETKETTSGTKGGGVNVKAKTKAESARSADSEGTNKGDDKDDDKDETSMTTKKWVQAIKNPYDGDDWGHYDQHHGHGVGQAPPPLQPPLGHDQTFNQPGRGGVGQDGETYRGVRRDIPAKGHIVDTPFSTPSLPAFNQTPRSVVDPPTHAPSLQHLPPQGQLNGQQYGQQHQQGGYYQPFPEQYRAQSYPPQDHQQYGQQQQYGAPTSQGYPQQNQQQYGQQQQQQYGTPPPPSLTPGYRTAPQGVKDTLFSYYQSSRS